MESKRNWYAVQRNAEDADWGTGSFDWDEAVEMAKTRGYEQIAEIDGNYDSNGDATTDEICVAEYHVGEDF